MRESHPLTAAGKKKPIREEEVEGKTREMGGESKERERQSESRIDSLRRGRGMVSEKQSFSGTC